MELKPLVNLKQLVSAQKTAAAVVACGVTFSIMVGAYNIVMKDVEVIDESGTYEVRTAAKTVKDALEKSGIALLPEDLVEPETDAVLKDGMEIHITRAIRVKITADGKTVGLLTTKKVVKDVIAFYCPTHEETERYGARRIKAYVLE